jgi:hypothetical protein
MERVRLRGLPPIPGLSRFPELNLRTYVTDRLGRPGVWFFSLEAGSRLAVFGGRNVFHLNYRRARMRVETESGGKISYRSRRASRGEPTQDFAWELPSGDLRAAETGSLEDFLLERYRLFAWRHRSQRLFSGEVSHEPYRFAPAKVLRYSTRLFALNGLAEPSTPPSSALAAPGFPVEIHPLRPMP